MPAVGALLSRPLLHSYEPGPDGRGPLFGSASIDVAGGVGDIIVWHNTIPLSPVLRILAAGVAAYPQLSSSWQET